MKQLDYIEFWACRHCNLNCKGCSSAAPICEEWFLNPNDLKKDLNRLLELQIDIHNIHILGGEPLLHPDLVSILKVTKEIYPNCNLGLLTNGILLDKMNNEFWITCKELSIKLYVTFFPIMSIEHRKKIISLIDSFELDAKYTDKKFFNKILNIKMIYSFDEITKNCGCKNAVNLFNGCLARCPVPFVVPDLNRRFKSVFKLGGYINIYNAHSGDEIIDFLDKYNVGCYNCSAYREIVPWERASTYPQLEDWLTSR